MDMYKQVNVFVDGMREGQNRLSLKRAESATLEDAFAIAYARTLGLPRLTASLRFHIRPDFRPATDGDRRDRVVG